MARYHPSMATRTTPRVEGRSSLALISHLAQVVRRDADQALADVDGMRPRHLVALTLLRDHGPMAQAALGEGLRLDPSNVVALLNDLEARGLVTRRRDPVDRRRHIVALSDGGVRALDRAEAGLAAVEDALLSGLSADERSTLRELLLRHRAVALPPHLAQTRLRELLLRHRAVALPPHLAQTRLRELLLRASGDRLPDCAEAATAEEAPAC